MLHINDAAHRWLRRPYELHKALDHGRADDTVVMLHGLASNGQVWNDLAARLAGSGHRVIAFDLLGFGESPKPSWSKYRVQDHARSLMYSLKRADVTFPLTLVGHSMGCLVAVHLASRYPRLVKRVVLYEPPLFADIPEFSTHARRRSLYFSIFERIAGSPTMVLTYARLLGRAARQVAGFALTQQTWLPFERSLRNTIMNQKAYAELHQLQVPTNIVYGRFDIVVTQAEIKQMFKDNPHIIFHNISDMHGISKRSAAYLAALITGTTQSKRRKVHRSAQKGKIRVQTAKEGRHASTME